MLTFVSTSLNVSTGGKLACSEYKIIITDEKITDLRA